MYLATDIYESVRSRTRRSAAVLAFWHRSDGEICLFNDTYLKSKPGLVEFSLLHNVLVDKEYKQHFLAKVQPLQNKMWFHHGFARVSQWC